MAIETIWGDWKKRNNMAFWSAKATKTFLASAKEILDSSFLPVFAKPNWQSNFWFDTLYFMSISKNNQRGTPMEKIKGEKYQIILGGLNFLQKKPNK